MSETNQAENRDEAFIAGLQVGIDTFEPEVRGDYEHLAELRKNGAIRERQAQYRGSMRAYAEVVGGLKTKKMVAQGKPTDVRRAMFDAYHAALGKADEIPRKLLKAKTQVDVDAIFAEREAADQAIDEIIVSYALDEV